jgi:hypothetical protein
VTAEKEPTMTTTYTHILDLVKKSRAACGRHLEPHGLSRTQRVNRGEQTKEKIE